MSLLNFQINTIQYSIKIFYIPQMTKQIRNIWSQESKRHCYPVSKFLTVKCNMFFCFLFYLRQTVSKLI